MESQTSEQLTVALEVSMLYQIEPANAPDLYQRIGSEATNHQPDRPQRGPKRGPGRSGHQIHQRDLLPQPRELAADMEREIQAKAGDRIEVVSVFVRDVKAPQTVQNAIEEKLQREQQVAAEAFQTEIIQERATQQAEEAKGIAEAQRIISEGLTPEYLTFFYIQQLTEMPEGSVVYVPTEAGSPSCDPWEAGDSGDGSPAHQEASWSGKGGGSEPGPATGPAEPRARRLPPHPPGGSASCSLWHFWSSAARGARRSTWPKPVGRR